MTKFTFFALLICLSACTNNDDSTALSSVPLFDVEAFLDTELSALNPQNVQKEISYNGQVETSDIREYDLTEDFEILKSVNINNPSWSDKYRIDTINADVTSTVIRYSATADKLPIRSMEVTMVNGVPRSFKATSDRNALVADSKKTIQYDSSSGYTINTITEKIASEKRSVTISVHYKPS